MASSKGVRRKGDGTKRKTARGRAPQRSPAPMSPLEEGILRFYASQAEVMLSQYRNIEDLLGPTSDYSHPGTHCEVLLREALQKFVPAGCSVHKGFIYGQTREGDQTRHCPEIDLLVHRFSAYRPIFQVGDFVIIRAHAAVAAVQVKRHMTTEQLREAVRNVADAKRHRLALAYAKSPYEFRTAVVFFDETQPPRKDGRISRTYENVLRENFSDPKSWRYAPDFVGSLARHHCYRTGYHKRRLTYRCLPSSPDGINVAFQALVWAVAGNPWSNLHYFGEILRERIQEFTITESLSDKGCHAAFR